MPRNRIPSPQTIKVLHVLAAEPARWRYGYELGAQTGLKAGSLYPILVRLADRGLLDAEWEQTPPHGRPARHLYRLTAAGLQLAAFTAAASAAAPAAPIVPATPAAEPAVPARAPRADRAPRGHTSPPPGATPAAAGGRAPTSMARWRRRHRVWRSCSAWRAPSSASLARSWTGSRASRGAGHADPRQRRRFP